MSLHKMKLCGVITSDWKARRNPRIEFTDEIASSLALLAMTSLG